MFLLAICIYRHGSGAVTRHGIRHGPAGVTRLAWCIFAMGARLVVHGETAGEDQTGSGQSSRVPHRCAPACVQHTGARLCRDWWSMSGVARHLPSNLGHGATTHGLARERLRDRGGTVEPRANLSPQSSWQGKAPDQGLPGRQCTCQPFGSGAKVW